MARASLSARHGTRAEVAAPTPITSADLLLRPFCRNNGKRTGDDVGGFPPHEHTSTSHPPPPPPSRPAAWKSSATVGSPAKAPVLQLRSLGAGRDPGPS